jgi:hypothetical protein
MKDFLFVFLITSLMISCKSNKRQTAKETTAVKPGLSQTADLIKEFKPIIRGVWVKKDYIEEIRRTKSPLAAMDVANDIITMDMNADSIRGDSLVVVHGNTHEGSQFMLKFHPGTTPNAISFDGDEIRYSVENGDTILSFSRHAGENEKVITTKYIRALVRKPNNDLASGINYLINKALITGTYLSKDSTGAVSRVIFKNDGSVSGFLNSSKYEINFDLNSDPMDNLDEIGFDIRTKNHHSFSFKIISDTLSLYNTYPNADSTELILGKRVYKLIRQK